MALRGRFAAGRLAGALGTLDSLVRLASLPFLPPFFVFSVVTADSLRSRPAFVTVVAGVVAGVVVVAVAVVVVAVAVVSVVSVVLSVASAVVSASVASSVVSSVVSVSAALGFDFGAVRLGL